MGNIQKYIVESMSNIRMAIQKIDKNGEGFVYVVDDNKKVIGLITDGDFRRSVINGISLNSKCIEIANKNFTYLDEDHNDKNKINLFLQNDIQNLPIIKNNKLLDIIFRRDLNLSNKVITPNIKSDMSIVIMAGGKGTRMKPFTNILPKPLIPIGEKSMLEVIMDEYNKYFKGDFHISVNHKANLIKAYLEEFKDLYNMSYVLEDKPLGTGGALKYLSGKIKKPFFVSNCDIIIKADYENIYNNHIKNKYDLTLIASMIHYKVPYGVCEINSVGELKQLKEKPEYDFLVNSGMYIVNPETLDLIPKNQFYNITELILCVKENGGRVGVFPVSEKSYLDAGQWKEYGNMLNILTK
ncbi:sugar phosphate nucleotidyltransferase [Flavobacteriaceae bacterium]|nr:sugar phosphate nucleotidyltransferase [Flavobacteriaceae bacterium]